MCSKVQSLSGKEVCSLSGITADTNIAELKLAIEELTGFSSSMMLLSINGRVTQDAQRVASYGWASGDVIEAMQLQTKDASNTCDRAMLLGDKAGAEFHFQQGSYGYLQIDNYAKKKHIEKATGAKVGPARWVSLPYDAEVLHASSSGVASKRSIPSPIGSVAACSSLHRNRKPNQAACHRSPSMCSVDSQSTIATTSERRRYVHFADGLVPSLDRQNSTAANEGYEVSPLAEWVYIDRDICGFSLYEYLPDDAEFRDFGSSHWGRLFREDLAQLQRESRRHHKAAMASESYKEQYVQEECELDLRLVDAGVLEQILQ